MQLSVAHVAQFCRLESIGLTRHLSGGGGGQKQSHHSNFEHGQTAVQHSTMTARAHVPPATVSFTTYYGRHIGRAQFSVFMPFQY